MSLPRLLQFVGFLIVTYVAVASFTSTQTMTFEFGGLILGGALFVLGRVLGGEDGAAGAD